VGAVDVGPDREHLTVGPTRSTQGLQRFGPTTGPVQHVCACSRPQPRGLIQRLASKTQPRLLIGGSPAVADDLNWMDLSPPRQTARSTSGVPRLHRIAAGFISRVQTIHARFPTWPLWITEFGVRLQRPHQHVKGAGDMVGHDSLDGRQPYTIQRYSWFGLCDGWESEKTGGLPRLCRR
jgi:hypothetical protein